MSLNTNSIQKQSITRTIYYLRVNDHTNERGYARNNSCKGKKFSALFESDQINTIEKDQK
jgi:hypothetical protein